MIHRALKLLRSYHQLSQTALAEKLEVSNTYLCEIEKGVKSPSIDLLSRYSQVFKMPLSTILLFSERLEKGSPPRERLRVAAADKVLKILEWIDDREAIA